MSKRHRKQACHPLEAGLFTGTRRKIAPHEFVLDAIAPLSPITRPMFGCLAVYVEDKIVLVLCDRCDSPPDNGVWLVTTAEHHESLQRDFPRMRSIRLFGTKVTSWQVLPADASDFEEAALRACRLILAHDPRIGKVPKSRLTSRSREKTSKAGRTGKHLPKPRKT